jgi:cysteine desulfuration protein SufE
MSTSPCSPSKRQRCIAAQEAIADEFSFFSDWSERYQYLIDLGKKLPSVSRRHGKPKSNRLTACQSMVWVVIEEEG